MAWLKRFGQIVLKISQIAVGFGPIASAMIPGDKDDQVIRVGTDALVQVASIITQVEVFGQALGIPGPDKLKAAAPAVAQVILQSSILAQHKIENPALFASGCTKIADGMAEVLNALKDNVETVDKT